jgi:hypothetical protein
MGFLVEVLLCLDLVIPPVLRFFLWRGFLLPSFLRPAETSELLLLAHLILCCVVVYAL